MARLSFRQKILLLAIALVIVMQIVTFYPVLTAIKRDSDAKARRTVQLAGAVLDEYMGNRNDQLLTTANVLVADFAFRDAAVQGDKATVRSVLSNHAARAGADIAMLFDLDGYVVASSLEESPGEPNRFDRSQLNGVEDGSHSVTYVAGRAYQTVTVLVRAPLPVARVLLGFEIDDEMARHIQSLTGLEVSFLTFGRDGVQTLTSTMPMRLRAPAIASLTAAEARASRGALALVEGPEHWTLLQPFLTGSPDLYAGLHLSVREAMSSYRDIRFILLAAIALSLMIAIASVYWVAGMVTRPVDRLAAAARRMREGEYGEVVEVDSTDELGELAAGFNAMQQAISERERHIYEVAHHNSLSGLPNRALVLERLSELLARCDSLQLVCLSIDRFGRLVSSLGYRASDELVRRVAERVRHMVADEHVLGHVNGHEFVVLMPGAAEHDALRLIDQIGPELHAGVRVDGANFSLQVSAGIASYPDHSSSAAGLLHRASIARNEAEISHQTVTIYQAGQEQRAVRQLRIIGDFPGAVERGEVAAYFQPKIDCASRAVIGTEALVRWNHGELGPLSPFEFVDAMEQAGSISHLTRWMIHAAVHQCRVWRSQGARIGVAVNISVDDLVDEYLPYYLLDLIKEYDLRPDELTLEVTESAIMHNPLQALSVVTCIHELGFRLSIDDFGTGQSSLAQLSRLPVDELKIDRSFIINMHEPKHETIVHATIVMAHRLGLEVCAEGIEDLSLLAKLHDMGAQHAQGFAVAKPLPAAEFLGWLAHWERFRAGIETRSAPRAVI